MSGVDPPSGLAMLNRFLFLLVAVISPASSVAMLFSGHPAGVTLAERVPCLAFALFALLLAGLHARPTTDRSAPFEAAMWLGLATLLGVAAYAAPHLGLWSILALLTLAGTSIVRLAGRPRSRRTTAGLFRRRAIA
jgi:peptidoglycan/LPS O-acetylase OafA/YrhL